MQLYVKVTMVRAGTAQPIGPALVKPCPPGVEPDSVLAFLTHVLGEPICKAWTSTTRHPRIDVGWVFPGPPGTPADPAPDLICVPSVRTGDGTLQPFFEVQADQRQDFEQLAADGRFTSATVIRVPLRDYQPTASAADPAGDPAVSADGDNRQPAGEDALHQILTQIAGETGAALHAYPRPGRAVRRTVLRDTHDAGGSQYEAAQIDDDGTLRILGCDQGPGVSEFFGAGITSYEWTYVVPPERVGGLAALAGGERGADPLDALTGYYQHHDGQLSDLLENPAVGAEFSNWPS